MRLVTSSLDLVGALLLILAASWLVSSWSIPAALAVAGGLLLLLSFLVDVLRKGAK